MAQASDGNWYGYFADSDAALAADATQAANSGLGLDFGSGCDVTSAGTLTGVTLTDTVGVFLRGTAGASVAGALASCTGPVVAPYNNVIRENKTLNDGTAGTANGIGNIGLSATNSVWPFIQLYDLNPTGSVVVNYNKGGGTQSTTLTFDTVDQFANLEADRTVFPTGANVHLTMTDVQLKH